MPTVHREEGFSFRIYPDDHTPPHVHVWKAGTVVKIALRDAESELSLLVNYGMSQRDARRALEIAMERRDVLLKAWRKYHGA